MTQDEDQPLRPLPNGSPKHHVCGSCGNAGEVMAEEIEPSIPGGSRGKYAFRCSCPSGKKRPALKRWDEVDVTKYRRVS